MTKLLELHANNGLLAALNINEALSRKWTLPKKLSRELEDIDYVEGAFLIYASSRKKQNLQNSRILSNDIERFEWSLNRIDLGFYSTKYTITVDKCFVQFLAACLLIKARAIYLKESRPLHFDFSFPIGKSELTEELENSSMSFHRLSERPVIDYMNLEGFKLQSMAVVIM